MDAAEFQRIINGCKDITLSKKVTFPNEVSIQSFTFGAQTLDTLLNLNFECTKCGKCCLDVNGKPCTKMQDFGETTNCTVYRTEVYPVLCELYPFTLDPMAREGLGSKVMRPGNPLMGENKKHVFWEFGIITGILTMSLHPADPCWETKNKSLREFYLTFLQILSNPNPVRPVNPYFEIFGLMLNGVKKYFRYDEIENNSRKFYLKLDKKRTSLNSKQAQALI